MRIRHEGDFESGCNEIVALDGPHSEMMMDYSVLKLKMGEEFFDEKALEKVYVLLYGAIEAECDDHRYTAKRESFLDNDFWLIDVPSDKSIKVTGLSDDTEIAIIRTKNVNSFTVKVHNQDNSVIETRGEGSMNGAGTRLVKTMMDHSLAPESNIMIGEDVHYPGKWSGFPSHSHAQPEIYFYKFFPKNGFGLLKLGDEGILLENNDTVTIEPNLVHPQVAAPGYAMYYLWIIRHLQGNPYIKPDFEEQHKWVEKDGAKYWPDLQPSGSETNIKEKR